MTEDNAVADAHNVCDEEFGTFTGRLRHFCGTMKVEPPELSYDEEGDVLVNQVLTSWCWTNDANLDWLLAGDPHALLKYSKAAIRSERKLMGVRREFEPELRSALDAFIRAVAIHSVPLEDAEKAFSKAVREFRGEAA